MNNQYEGKVSDQEYTQYPYVTAQTIMPNDKADLLDKIKPDLIVEIIRHRLMGEELVKGEWKKNPNLKEKALSFKGAWDISNLMLGVSSQNVALSKLNDREIRNRTLSIVKTAMRLCLRNWKEYGIYGVDQLYFVYEIVISNTFITLKQPEGEGMRRFIGGSWNEQHVHNDNQTNKEGLLSGIFRR